MTYTCKHCGKKVEALTICGCDMAQNEFFSGETKPATMSYATGKLTSQTRIEELTAENERLTAELKATDTLLENRNRVMAVIPECPVHGEQCVPYAIDWIDSIRTERAELRKANGNLTAELAAVRAELAECRQAAFENGRETERAAGYGELPF